MTSGASLSNPTGLRSTRKPVGENTKLGLLLLPAVLYLLVFFAYPLIKLLSLSIFDPSFTLRHYEVVLASPVYLAVLQTTMKLSLLTTVFCLLLGYPLAYVLATSSDKVRNMLLIAVVLPYFTSVLVRSYAWLVILGRHGILNEAMVATGIIDQPIKMIYNSSGVVIGMTHIMLPIMVLALYSVMRGIDMNFVRVSDSLGASKIQTFLRVYFPLSVPGVGAGALLVFIFSIGFYVTPALLGGLRDTMLAMLIANQIQELLNWGFAGALSLVLLVVTLCLFLAFNRAMGLDRIWGADKVRDADTSHRTAWRWLMPLRTAWQAVGGLAVDGIEWVLDLVAKVISLPVIAISAIFALAKGPPTPKRGMKRDLTISILAGSIIVFLLAPIALIFPVSFTNSLYLRFPPSGFSLQWYQELVDTVYWSQALWLSLRVAPVSMVLAVILGTLGAIALARCRFPFKELIFSFILSPLIVPVIVTAVALYYFYSQVGLVGSFWGLVFGHTIGSIPVVVVMVAAALKGFDIRLENAAMSLGASRPRAFIDVTLPLVRPAIIVSAFFAFIHSFDEVVIASFVGDAASATLPMRMWVDVRQDIKPTLAAVSALMVLFTIVMLLATNHIQARDKTGGEAES